MTLPTLVLCCWSSLLIFAWMLRGKFYWRPAPLDLIVLCIAAGALCTVPALLCNAFLARETELWAFSPNRLHSLLGILIGPGMGEELCKMAAGLIALTLVRRDPGPAGRMLGMVVVGLTFATVENQIGYSELGVEGLTRRGITAVPVHGAMGFIHGLGVNRAWPEHRALPLFAAYIASVVFHTAWDTISIQMPAYSTAALAALLAAAAGWSVIVWRSTPEVDQLLLEAGSRP